MIKLKNIQINNSVIECDIYPEDSLQAGHIVVDTETKAVRELKLPIGYEWCKNHANHAKNKLLEFIEIEKIPEEKLIMWN